VAPQAVEAIEVDRPRRRSCFALLQSLDRFVSEGSSELLPVAGVITESVSKPSASAILAREVVVQSKGVEAQPRMTNSLAEPRSGGNSSNSAGTSFAVVNRRWHRRSPGNLGRDQTRSWRTRP